MILCSCNIISDARIQECIQKYDKLTVGQLFQELECQPQCATCIKNIAKLLKEQNSTTVTN